MMGGTTTVCEKWTNANCELRAGADWRRSGVSCAAHTGANVFGASDFSHRFWSFYPHCFVKPKWPSSSPSNELANAPSFCHAPFQKHSPFVSSDKSFKFSWILFFSLRREQRWNFNCKTKSTVIDQRIITFRKAIGSISCAIPVHGGGENISLQQHQNEFCSETVNPQSRFPEQLSSNFFFRVVNSFGKHSQSKSGFTFREIWLIAMVTIYLC